MDHRFRHVTPLSFVLGIIALLTVAVGAAIQTSANVLSELRIDEKRAREQVVWAVWDGYPVAPGGVDVFTAAPPEKRAAIVRGLAAFVKAYTRTDDFRKQYAQYREDNAPQKPDVSSASDATQGIKDAIKEAQDNLKNASSAEERAAIQESISAMQAQLQTLNSPQMKATMEAGSKQAEAENAARYAEELKEYAAMYPKEPNVLIARRLREFLDMSATVDFNAKVAKSFGFMRFTDPTYESKPKEWKLCYRAGKEAVDAARAVATEWLKELRPGT